jgi:hypothetical protein
MSITKKELIEYYGCPPHLADEAKEYCDNDPGRNPSEYVQALVEADEA